MVVADRRLTPSKQRDYRSFNKIGNTVDVPNLVQVQVNSFTWLKTDGLKDLFDEISPIEDFSGGRFELRFLKHEMREQEFRDFIGADVSILTETKDGRKTPLTLRRLRERMDSGEDFPFKKSSACSCMNPIDSD